jgi:hypothetical protein
MVVQPTLSFIGALVIVFVVAIVGAEVGIVKCEVEQRRDHGQTRVFMGIEVAAA